MGSHSEKTKWATSRELFKCTPLFESASQEGSTFKVNYFQRVTTFNKSYFQQACRPCNYFQREPGGELAPGFPRPGATFNENQELLSTREPGATFSKHQNG